jgi:uncharacterized protein (TIGR03435 family)
MAQPAVAGLSELSWLRPTQTGMPVRAVPANRLLSWFVLFWLAGALAYSLRLIIGCFAAARLRFRSVRLAPPEWQQNFGELGTKIRVSRPVRLMVSGWAEAPAVVGWLRPVVLLPVGMLTGLPPDQIEALLLHELAHVRRHDYLVNILQSVIEGLLFYHPAVWWVSGHIRTEREACCDDLAVSASGDVLTYVRALTELALLRPLRLAPAVAASGGSLANRVARLLGTSRPTTGPRPPLVGVIAGALLLVVTGFGVFAQTARPRTPFNASGVNTSARTFEAADVHASPRAANPYTYASGGVLRGGRYDLRKATMLDLIRTAWNVDPDIIVGGPNWLALDRFDVSAKAPPQTPPETIRLMLQALLRDRFGLVIHKDTRSMQAYALTAGKNKPKLTESNGSGNQGCQYEPQPSPAMFRVYACRNITLDAFSQTLRQLASDYLAAPVVNETRLEGAWDFDLKFTSRSRVLQPDANPTTIFEALDQQLGLKLALKTAPEPVLVVDRVNEKPTPNPADTEKLLPPRAVQFEVATIKPSRPEEERSSRVSPDHYDVHATSLDILIFNGFDIPTAPAIWDESHLIAGLPKWATTERFDVTAKLPSDAFGPPGNPFTDDLRLMLRNLLIERFGIKFHYEDRPALAYTLVAAKPKMKKADPSGRANCNEAGVMINDPRDSNPRLNRLVSCQSVTMTQFARLLGDFASLYVDTPVEDATGLDGAWDFTLSFSDAPLLTSPAAGNGTAAPDLNGVISLEDAINKQLGLKLEKRRRMVPILVIDHLEEKPTDN